jgi:hypothetical protein
MVKKKPLNFEPRRALQLVPNSTPARAPRLSEPMRGRLRNQLARAFNHSFGSENGLQVLAKLVTEQMLRSGSTRAEIREELTRCVSEHPGSGTARLSLIDGKPRADTLTALLLQWSDLTEPS